MSARKSWLEKLVSRRAQRRTAEQLAAYRWTGSGVKKDGVRDISLTGVYIITEERMPPGTYVSLTLQKEGPLEKRPERRITSLAKVVRCGDDGVGLSFVAAKDRESREWERLLESMIEQTKPEDMLSLVRMAEALGFLTRICPGGVKEVGLLVREKLSNHKVENAVGVVLGAEKLMTSRPPTAGTHAHPRLVVRILEEGSCTGEEWLQQYWGGLLLSSCSVDGKDESNLTFVEIFAELTTIPVRILTVVCTRATKVLLESGAIYAKPLDCKIDELTVITGSRESQVERDIDRLSSLGLLEKRSTKASPTLLPSDKAYITPSSLGLQLFARWNGHQGALRDFYAVESPALSVAAREP